MNRFASLTAQLALSTMIGGTSLAQDTVSPHMSDAPSTTTTLAEDFTQASACEPILYRPHITQEQRDTARQEMESRRGFFTEYFDEAGEIIPEELEQYIIDRFELLGGRVPFPDLTAHPRAGRDVKLQLRAIDGLSQTGRSETVSCVLPIPELSTAASLALFQLRGDMAEFVATQSWTEFQDITLPELARRYNEFVDGYEDTLKKDENKEKLYALEPLFDHAETSDDIGNLLDELWITINTLEKDEVSAALEKMREIRQEIREEASQEGMRGLSQEERKEFMEQMFEAMKEALQEQLEEAIENDNQELQEELEDMLEQLEEWQEMMQQMEEINRDQFLDTYDMMREMMRMQIDQSMNPNMQQMMRSMQRMQSFMQQSMQQMMEALQDQQNMDALKEMLEQQRNLLDDTAFTEEMRQNMLNQIRDSLDGLAEGLEETSRNLADEIEEDIPEAAEAIETEQDAEVEEVTERLQEMARELKERLHEGRDSGDLSEGEREQLDAVEEELDKALKRMDIVETLNSRRLRPLFRQLQEADDDLNRILGEEEEEIPSDPAMTEDGNEIAPSEPTRPLDERLEDMDETLLEMMERHNAQDAEIKQQKEDAERLRDMEKEIGDIREQLQDTDSELSEEDMQELMKQLQDLQSELAEHQETDMNSIQKMVLQLAQQLNNRVDEVGALEYLKEARARNTGATDEAQQHDTTQIYVIELGDEVDDIRDDIIERTQKEHPLTEEEAAQTITRLEEIKAILDEIDPRPPEERSQNQQQPGGGEGQPQPPMTPNELMQRLMEMMERNQNKTEMQRQLEQQLQEMMEQSQGLGEQQKSLEEQLEEMRQQLQEMGIPDDQIEETIQKMRDAAEQLGQGKPGQAMPGQNGAMDLLNQMMQQQLQPGSGMGPGNGDGEGEGYNEDNFGQSSGNQGGKLDEEMIDGLSPEIQSIMDQLNNENLSPQTEEYLRGLLEQMMGGGTDSPSP